MNNEMPESTRLLMEFWDRRDTAGFYELEEIVSRIQAETREQFAQEIANIQIDFIAGHIDKAHEHINELARKYE